MNKCLIDCKRLNVLCYRSDLRTKFSSINGLFRKFNVPSVWLKYPHEAMLSYCLVE